MEFTLDKIIEVMNRTVADLENQIGQSGSNSQAASRLKSEVSYFKQGVISGLSAPAKFGYDSELEIEIPKEWEKYFYDELRKADPEYDEFLRLKEKFKNYK